MSLRERVRRISFNVLFGVVLGVALVFIGLQFVESPLERGLRRELAQYKRQFELLLPRVERAEKVLSNLEERDEVLYRTIFECEPVSDAERFSGIGGVERYASLDGYDNSLGFENADIVFLTDGECSLPDAFAEDFRRKQTEKNYTVTGILLDMGCPGTAFSLTPFCRKIYRTSQLCGEDIVRSVISELAA